MRRLTQLALLFAALGAVAILPADDPADVARFGYLRYMDYAPDGHAIAVATARAVEIWDSALSKKLQTYPLEPMASRMRLAWSPDSKSLVLNTDQRIILWDASLVPVRKEISYGGFLPPMMQATSPPSLQWSPRGDRIAYLADANYLPGPMILEHNSPYWINPIPPRPGLPMPGQSKMQGRGLREVAWSPDGGQIAGITDEAVQIWDADSGAEIRVLKLAPLSGMTGRRQERWPLLSWSPTGAKIATCDHFNFVQIWDAATGDILLKLDGGNSTHARLAWSRKGDRVALATEQAVTIWDATSGARLSQTLSSVIAEYAAFSPDLDHAVLATRDGQVELWPPVQLTKAAPGPQYAAWGAGDKLAVWGTSGAFRVIDYSRKTVALEAQAAIWGRQSFAWSPGGESLAVPDSDGVISAYAVSPLPSSKPYMRFTGAKAPVYAVAFSPTKSSIVALAGGSLWIWNFSRLDRPQRFAVAGTGFVWTSDHTILIAGLQGDLVEFDLNTGRSGWTFSPPGPGVPDPLSLAPGGSFFFGKGAIWRRGKSAEIALPGIKPPVFWPPDGTTFATPDPRFGAPLQIRSIATGNAVSTLKLQPGLLPIIGDLAWSNDGLSLAITTTDGSTFVHRLGLEPKN
jgi:WD40 repeat protein